MAVKREFSFLPYPLHTRYCFGKRTRFKPAIFNLSYAIRWNSTGFEYCLYFISIAATIGKNGGDDSTLCKFNKHLAHLVGIFRTFARF